MVVIRGGCLCGTIRYEIEGDPVIVSHCHCTGCQRISGAGHTTGAVFPATAVTVRGQTSEYRLDSSADSVVTRTFCPRCGSPLFGRNDRMPGFTTVTAGTLDDPDAVLPRAAIYARSRRRWDVMDPSLPTFDTQPDWKPEDG
jgi:hypothetical protein